MRSRREPLPSGSVRCARDPCFRYSRYELSPPLSESAVADATGGKPASSDGTVKVSFPRTDVLRNWQPPRRATLAGENASAARLSHASKVLLEKQILWQWL
jgi:hypothetical protein